MHLDHAVNLVQARSCLAALADRAHTEDGNDAYERALIDLDRINGDQSPAVDPQPARATHHLLLQHASLAITQLARFGIDGLLVELLLADIADAYTLDDVEDGA